MDTHQVPAVARVCVRPKQGTDRKERVSATKEKLQRACQLQRLPARELASIVGKIISMGLAIGPRSMYSLLDTRDAWYDLLEISAGAHHELEVWKATKQPICQVPSVVRVEYSDASESGYGGYVVEHGGCLQWPVDGE